MSDDDDLWANFTKDIKRNKELGTNHTKALLTSKRKNTPKTAHSTSNNDTLKASKPVALSENSAKKSIKNKDIDAATERKIKRGKLAIEAKLDLHGLTKDEARMRLISFLKKCHAQNKRLVLVVTGKGLSKMSDDQSRGVIKRSLASWLSDDELNGIVLKNMSARMEHGGEGASYIYLRRPTRV